MTLAPNIELEESARKSRTPTSSTANRWAKFIVFDLIEEDGVNLSGLSVEVRLRKLAALAPAFGNSMPVPENHLHRSREARPLRRREGPRRRRRRLQAPRIDLCRRPPQFRRRLAQIQILRDAHRASLGRQHEALGRLAGFLDGSHLAPVGNVTIPANKDIPTPGAFVEVRYLHAYQDGSLYEPVLLCERSDVDASACRADQRKFKNC